MNGIYGCACITVLICYPLRSYVSPTRTITYGCFPCLYSTTATLTGTARPRHVHTRSTHLNYNADANRSAIATPTYIVAFYHHRIDLHRGDLATHRLISCPFGCAQLNSHCHITKFALSSVHPPMSHGHLVHHMYFSGKSCDFYIGCFRRICPRQ